MDMLKKINEIFEKIKKLKLGPFPSDSKEKDKMRLEVLNLQSEWDKIANEVLQNEITKYKAEIDHINNKINELYHKKETGEKIGWWIFKREVSESKIQGLKGLRKVKTVGKNSMISCLKMRKKVDADINQILYKLAA